MIKVLHDYTPAFDRIDGLFERWYDRHPSHRDRPRLSAAVRARLCSAVSVETRCQAHPADVVQECMTAMRDGESIGSIHRRTNISESTLRRWGNSAGIAFASHRAPPELKAEAMASIARGELPTAIALRLRVDPSTISRWGRAAGYKYTRGVNSRLIERPE